MVDPRGILKSWRCRRVQPLLVDTAEQGLDERQRVYLNRHLAACDDCRAALAALQQVPAMLRELPPPRRDEEFWRRQRQAILRRLSPIDTPADAAVFSRRFTWGAGIAAAAAVALVLVALRGAAPPPVNVAEVEGLDADDVVALADLTQAWDGPADTLVHDSLSVDLDAVEVPSVEPERAEPEADVGDLDDEELQRLEDLIG